MRIRNLDEARDNRSLRRTDGGRNQRPPVIEENRARERLATPPPRARATQASRLRAPRRPPGTTRGEYCHL
eukprot:4882465-Pyramimonas_sp.AAC.1